MLGQKVTLGDKVGKMGEMGVGIWRVWPYIKLFCSLDWTSRDKTEARKLAFNDYGFFTGAARIGTARARAAHLVIALPRQM